MELQFGIRIDDGSEFLSSFGSKENTKRSELYDWQNRALEYFIENKKVIINSPTGAGKSRIAIELIKYIFQENSNLKILVVVPKNVILEDTWYKELYQNGISLPDIGVYYGKIKEYSKITLTNVQNLDSIDLSLFSVLIIDECHNVTKRVFDIIQVVEWKYMIGLSATYERRDNKHWDLLKMFNYNLFSYTPKQALADGILNPFYFTSIGVELDETTEQEYKTLTQQLNLIYQTYGNFNKILRGKHGIKNKMLFLFTKRKELLANYVRKFDVAQAICKKHKDDKMIIFNQYNSQTNACYWYLLECDVKVCIVHSGMDEKKREENLINFRNNKYNVMLASKVLDEGVNIPAMDVGIIMASDAVKRQAIQRMGRVLRKKDHPSHLYLLYCKNTFEEDNSLEQGKIFKELAISTKETVYKLFQKTVDI